MQKSYTFSMQRKKGSAKDILLGLAIGDALGVPFEFRPRFELDKEPVLAMVGHGTWNQVPGTFSDDSSLSFCLAESLCLGFNPEDIAERFIAWMDEAYWSAHGRTFDIGKVTRNAIERLKKHDIDPCDAGLRRDEDNGNGSLMRIAPLLVFIEGLDEVERFMYIEKVSSITHAHPRCIIACTIFCEFALELMQGKDNKSAYKNMQERIIKSFDNNPELNNFSKILSGDISLCSINTIKSSGYVVDSLEASLWSYLNANNYKDTVLNAVNLGEDTDTIAAIAGALAGIQYGYEAIPNEWLSNLARKDDIINLADRLEEARKTGFIR